MMEARIQSYLRFAAGHGRDTERIGPFLATFSPGDDNPYVNYAIPDDAATPSPADVAALIGAYERRGRAPRFEYIAQLAPAVEGALLAAGFVVEGRPPLMTCAPGMERSLPAPPDMELVLPVSDAELLATMTAQNEAYGGQAPGPEAVPGFRAGLADGQIAVLARLAATGEPVGAGVCTVPHNQTTEVTGIGVREPFRRRGVAAALTGQLAREAFGVGVTVAFLMAADEGVARIYARAGFSLIGEVLHISRPLG